VCRFGSHARRRSGEVLAAWAALGKKDNRCRAISRQVIRTDAPNAKPRKLNSDAEKILERVSSGITANRICKDSANGSYHYQMLDTKSHWQPWVGECGALASLLRLGEASTNLPASCRPASSSGALNAIPLLAGALRARVIWSSDVLVVLIPIPQRLLSDHRSHRSLPPLALKGTQDSVPILIESTVANPVFDLPGPLLLSLRTSDCDCP
jgi:hypothetical protein